MAGERWLETPQGTAWAAEQKAAQAESDMSGLLANVTADIPAGTGSAGSGGADGSSADEDDDFFPHADRPTRAANSAQTTNGRVKSG